MMCFAFAIKNKGSVKARDKSLSIREQFALPASLIMRKALRNSRSKSLYACMCILEKLGVVVVNTSMYLKMLNV